MLIVEGPDCVGKTSIAQELIKFQPLAMRGYVYKHLSRLPDGFHRVLGYRDNAVRRSVQDRFHMSEPVYASMRGEKLRMCREEYHLVDAQLRLMGALTILITAERSVIEKRFGEKPEMYKLDDVLRVNDGYMILEEEWEPDVRWRFHLTDEHPLIDSVTLGRIVQEYIMHQQLIDRISQDDHERKTTGLSRVSEPTWEPLTLSTPARRVRSSS